MFCCVIVNKMKVVFFVGIFLIGYISTKPLDEDGGFVNMELGPHFQGDILIGDEEQRNGILGEQYRWQKENGIVTIPYEIDESDPLFTQQYVDMVKQGLEEWPGMTGGCFQWVEKRDTDEYWVRITGEQLGCFSYVGRQNRFFQPQQLNLQPGSPGCIFDTSIGQAAYHSIQHHEQLHAMGFYHEQSRPDRDDYVAIMYQNIEEGYEHNFDKYDTSQVTTFGVTYDYDSVMHYGAYDFSSNGQETIVVLDENYTGTIGQRRAPSQKDLEKLMLMYGYQPNDTC